MKCPYCGDETKQKEWGEIKRKQTAANLPPTILWRCGKCAYLYAVPDLTDGDEPEPPHCDDTTGG